MSTDGPSPIHVLRTSLRFVVAVHSALDGVMHNWVRAHRDTHQWLSIGVADDSPLPSILAAQGGACRSRSAPSSAIDPRTPRSLRTLHPLAPPIRSLASNQTSRGSNDGASSPWNHAITAASRYANTDRPC
jgi:hypothetical protein